MNHSTIRMQEYSPDHSHLPAPDLSHRKSDTSNGCHTDLRPVQNIPLSRVFHSCCIHRFHVQLHTVSHLPLLPFTVKLVRSIGKEKRLRLEISRHSPLRVFPFSVSTARISAHGFPEDSVHEFLIFCLTVSTYIISHLAETRKCCNVK